ncbi:amidohydrolase family protein [Brucellaceae bacterium D45D]
MPGFTCLCHSPAFARLSAIVERKLSQQPVFTGMGFSSGAAGLRPKNTSAQAMAAKAKSKTFTNIRIFDGQSKRLIEGHRVVVEGNMIKSVDANSVPLASGTDIIDGGGRTLMPGLIDAHWHVILAPLTMKDFMTADAGYITLACAKEADATLMRGFTSVRDLAGPTFGIKRAIDSGMTAGPRIWPSGACISQTGGHGDFRLPYEVPAEFDAAFSRAERLGAGMVADGIDQVLKRAREQLMLGASQLKLAAGGGVASNYDPIDVSQYTEAEFRAAVDCAENWGTYVTVHAYTPRAIQTAIRGGVRCIEHGQLMDEDTARMIADNDIWLSAQPFVSSLYHGTFPEGSFNDKKEKTMFAGTETAYGLAQKHGLKTAWGTDVIFNAALAKEQNSILAGMVKWYAPEDVLIMATGTNAELLAMSGPRNPYPGKVGVIEAGAYADILLIDGDPIADIKLLADPDKNLKIIMKDGHIYKNTLLS